MKKKRTFHSGEITQNTFLLALLFCFFPSCRTNTISYPRWGAVCFCIFCYVRKESWGIKQGALQKAIRETGGQGGQGARGARGPGGPGAGLNLWLLDCCTARKPMRVKISCSLWYIQHPKIPSGSKVMLFLVMGLFQLTVWLIYLVRYVTDVKGVL